MVGYWGEHVTTAEQARELIGDTGARGLAGDLFVDGALGSHTAWLHRPYADAPDCCGNSYLDADAITTHLTPAPKRASPRDSTSSVTPQSPPS